MSPSKIKILFVGVNPDDTDLLELTQEARAIKKRLRTTKFRERFELEQEWEAEATDLPGLLMEHEPQILHFSGHGSAEGRLNFRGTDGLAMAADAECVAAVFRPLEGVRCVVLNACHSSEQAQLIAEHVDVVVGMRAAVWDRDAAQFAAGFYEALGYGKDVKTAFDLGRVGIGLATGVVDEVCVLHVREGVDASALMLHEPESEHETQANEGSVSSKELEHYLERTRCKCEKLPLLGFRSAKRLRTKLGELCVSLRTDIDPRARAADIYSDAQLSEEGGRRSREVESLDLAGAIAYAKRYDVRGLVLLGDPGTGKTTFLLQALLGALDQPGSLGLPPNTVPVFLPLRELRDDDVELQPAATTSRGCVLG